MGRSGVGMKCLCPSGKPSAQRGKGRPAISQTVRPAAKAKAWHWLMEHSIARFDWRKQGLHASEDHKQPG